MYNIIIYSNDEDKGKVLQTNIQETHFTIKLYMVTKIKDVIDLLEHVKIDIVVIDIGTIQVNNFEILKLISKLYHFVQSILITTLIEDNIEYSLIEIYNYLFKFKERIEIRNYSDRLDLTYLISVKDNSNSTIILPLKEIIYFEKNGSKIMVHTTQAEYTMCKTLKQLENQLFDNFYRVHQSFIINLDHIKRITEFVNRSYVIEFHNTDKTAYMSRYKFEKLNKNLII